MKDRVLYQLNGRFIILLFLLVTFIPLLTGVIIEDNRISVVEKRKMVLLPSIPKTIGGIKEFPKLFESYYSDHFGLRDWFTKYYKMAKYRIGDSPSGDVTLGKNGWLFLGSIKHGYSENGDPMGDVRNVNLYSPQELKRFAHRMNGINEFLKEKGITYIFVIAPNKHTIYFDQLPDYISRINTESATDQLVNYLAEHSTIPVVDLRGAFKKAKDRNQLYYKTDTHWNHYAANIAQYEIMKVIEKIFPTQIQAEIFSLKIGVKGGGDLANYVGIGFFQDINPQPVFVNSCTPVRESLNAKGRNPHAYTCEDQELNTLIFRDSFFSSLIPYFSRKFKRSTYIWSHLEYSVLTNFIELEKPNVIIEEWVERSLPYVPKLSYEYIAPIYKKLFSDSNDMIYSADWSQLELHRMDKSLDGENNESLKLRSTGNDPTIILPVVKFEPNNQYMLHIDMTSSVESTLQVFYSDSTQTGNPFSEKNSHRLKVNKGENDVYVFIDHPTLGGRIRFDPIQSLGEITLKTFEIKTVDKPF